MDTLHIFYKKTSWLASCRIFKLSQTMCLERKFFWAILNKNLNKDWQNELKILFDCLIFNLEIPRVPPNNLSITVLAGVLIYFFSQNFLYNSAFEKETSDWVLRWLKLSTNIKKKINQKQDLNQTIVSNYLKNWKLTNFSNHRKKSKMVRFRSFFLIFINWIFVLSLSYLITESNHSFSKPNYIKNCDSKSG